jgi:lipoate-protein ligase A
VSTDYGGHGVDGEELKSSLLNRELHQITDWEKILPPFVANHGERRVTLSPGRELNRLFGGGSYNPSKYIGA